MIVEKIQHLDANEGDVMMELEGKVPSDQNLYSLQGIVLCSFRKGKSLRAEHHIYDKETNK